MTDEINRINYRLRSTFFYRKLKEYKTLSFPSQITALLPVKHLYIWEDRKKWGIGEDAFTYISNHQELELIQVFCHPRLIREYPSLLAYYRNIAILSQKAVQYLAKVNLKKIESDQDNKYNLSEDNVLALCQLFNEHISLIIDSSLSSLTAPELYGLLLASTGSQIDGSWRNAIGEEAENIVQKLLIKEAQERNLLVAFIPKKGVDVELYNSDQIDEQIENINSYRGVMLANYTSILFSKEPDISILNNQGITVGVIEVKGGTDPAGALERYGAAKKSFEEALRINPTIKTILIASCITPEVNNRIHSDPVVSAYFNLTEILTEESPVYDQFMQEIFSLFNQ